ncbi:DUF6928 family protein [Kitasatospora sp. NPDC058444]|uniref:DUF6928 family protein n=1 Tax=Kitasatospora sp. NPDC058444 TaxID=3346504 RepID=UPI0036624C9F
MVLHAMHSVVDWLAFGVWEDGRLVRSLSLSPDSGIIEDIGEPLSFEVPSWARERPADIVPWPDEDEHVERWLRVLGPSVARGSCRGRPVAGRGWPQEEEGARMAVGRAGTVLLALGGVLIAAGGVTAVVCVRDSGGVVTQENIPLTPEMQKYAETPAAFEEYLRSHPPKPLMGEIRGGGK